MRTPGGSAARQQLPESAARRSRRSPAAQIKFHDSLSKMLKAVLAVSLTWAITALAAGHRVQHPGVQLKLTKQGAGMAVGGISLARLAREIAPAHRHLAQPARWPPLCGQLGP